MKMQNAEMEFVAFDAQDVIMTSITPVPPPLAYATGNALLNGEDYFNSRGASNAQAVNALGYEGYALHDYITNPDQEHYDDYFAITDAGKSGSECYVSFEQTPLAAASLLSGIPTFSSPEALKTWIAGLSVNQ